MIRQQPVGFAISKGVVEDIAKVLINVSRLEASAVKLALSSPKSQIHPDLGLSTPILGRLGLDGRKRPGHHRSPWPRGAVRQSHGRGGLCFAGFGVERHWQR